MALADKEKIDKLEEELKHVIEKLARCRREQCEKDHDTIIKLNETQETIRRDIEKMNKIMNEQVTEIDESMTKTSQLAGNINQLTDKIADIVKSDTARKRFVYTIFAGILISIISALVIWVTSSTVNNMLKINTQDIDKLQQTIESVQHEIKDIKKIGNNNDSKNIQDLSR